MPVIAGLLRRVIAKIQVCEHGWSCRACCWPWTGARSKTTGHGNVFVSKRPRKNLGPHVVIWMWWNDCDVPSGCEICHSCDNGACCQPAHVWAGTHGDNMKDAYRKGRRMPNDALPTTRGAQHWTHRTPLRHTPRTGPYQRGTKGRFING
jgi:HNH endonuclease